MKEIKMYKCEICEFKSESEKYCAEHEKEHSPVVRVNKIKRSIYDMWYKGYASEIEVEYVNGITLEYVLSKTTGNISKIKAVGEEKQQHETI